MGRRASAHLGVRVGVQRLGCGLGDAARVLESLGRPETQEPTRGGGRGRRPSVAAGPGCRARAGVPPGRTHLAPRAGPALGAPPPGSRRRARPPGAAASSWGWGDGQPGPRICPAPPPPRRVRARRSPTPGPVLPAGPVRSAGATASHRRVPQPRREKSLIPGGGARAGTRGCLHPPAQRSPPQPPLDRCSDSASSPTSAAPGNPHKFLRRQSG